MKSKHTLNLTAEKVDTNGHLPNHAAHNPFFPAPMGDESPFPGADQQGLLFTPRTGAKKVASKSCVVELAAIEGGSNVAFNGLHVASILSMAAEPEQQRRLIIQSLVNAGIYDRENVFGQKNFALSFLVSSFHRILQLREKGQVTFLVNYRLEKKLGNDMLSIHQIFTEVFPKATVDILSEEKSLEALTRSFVAVNQHNKSAFHIVLKGPAEKDTEPSKLEEKYRMINITSPGRDVLSYFLLGASYLTEQSFTEEDDTWMRQTSYQDLAKNQALVNIARGMRGLTRTPPRSVSQVIKSEGLKSLVLDGTVSEWVGNLVEDIHAFRQGEIEWEMIDKGAIFTGAPGTGKTCLAQAIAKDSGLFYVQVSASADWMGAGSLDACVSAVKETFDEAKKHAPSIVFIDEIDGIGNRASGGSRADTWVTWLVNTLLTEINEAGDSQVILLAATNNIDNVDQALKRAGRLDKVIPVLKPGEDALKSIYQLKLASLTKGKTVLSDADLQTCATNSVGMTGAEVERTIKTALRKSRKARRSLMVQDVVESIFGIPENNLRCTKDVSVMDAIASHEVGHAIVAHGVGIFRVEFLSINPLFNTEGQARFTPRVSTNTARGVRDIICVSLAGLAAEELRYGVDGLSTGSSSNDGGDIQRAIQLAQDYYNKYGFGGVEKTVNNQHANDEQIRQLIASEYERAKSIIQKNIDLFMKMQKDLLDKTYLMREQIAEILGTDA